MYEKNQVAAIVVTAFDFAEGNFFQLKIDEGYFTSEAVTVVNGEEIMVSIKRYNPTEDEIKQAARPKKNAPMNYLQLPLNVTNASLHNNGFESILYCFNKGGIMQWQRDIGFSKNSEASPVAADNGFLYTGEGMKEAGKIKLLKFDNTGKIIWSKIFDSLENVNAIRIAGKMVNILASFEVSKKVSNPDQTFSYNTYPIYFFIQLDTETGDLVKKEYQMMGNYLSSIGFKHPYISSYTSYYLNNNDSAIFLNVANQESATVVSEELPKENKIINLIAGPSENHYLTIVNEDNASAAYVLYSDFYGVKEKHNSTLNVKPGMTGYSRTYLLKNEQDSIITVLAKGKDLAVCYTDKSGKTNCSIKEGILTSTVAGAGLLGTDKPYVIIIKGRERPGEPGKIELLKF